jgi:hypothetical protein
MRPIILALGLALALTGTGFAQNNPGQNNQNAQQRNQNAQQQVTNDLKAAGFTDIKIMPESFLVRAKDKSGNPVMMVINPDSITAVTEVNSSKGSSTTGAAPNTGNNPNQNNAPSRSSNSPK